MRTTLSLDDDVAALLEQIAEGERHHFQAGRERRSSGRSGTLELTRRTPGISHPAGRSGELLFSQTWNKCLGGSGRGGNGAGRQMILVDVNLLVYAWDRRAPLHERAVRWLDGKLSESARVGLPWSACSASCVWSPIPASTREPAPVNVGVAAGGALAERPAMPGYRCRGIATRRSWDAFLIRLGGGAKTDSRRPSGSSGDRARTRPVLDRRRFCAIRRLAMGESSEPQFGSWVAIGAPNPPPRGGWRGRSARASGGACR